MPPLLLLLFVLFRCQHLIVVGIFFFLTWAGNKLRTFKCKNRPELRLLTRGRPAGSASKVFSIAMPDATPSLWGYLLRAVRELALALSVCFCCLPWSTVYLLPVPCCTTFFVGSRICPRFMSHTHTAETESRLLWHCVCVWGHARVCAMNMHAFIMPDYCYISGNGVELWLQHEYYDLNMRTLLSHIRSGNLHIEVPPVARASSLNLRRERRWEEERETQWKWR